MSRSWAPAEREMLLSLCGDLPWPKVVATHRRWAAANGMPKRSDYAMRNQCVRLNVSRKSVGEYVNTGVICELLGLNHQTVQRWARTGLLPTWRRGNGATFCYYIRRKDLRRLARERPHLFGGQAEATLVQLLDSESLARQITEMDLPVCGKSKPLICVETNRRYPNARSAANDVYIAVCTLKAVIDNPARTAAGYHWRRA